MVTLGYDAGDDDLNGNGGFRIIQEMHASTEFEWFVILTLWPGIIVWAQLNLREVNANITIAFRVLDNLNSMELRDRSLVL